MARVLSTSEKNMCATEEAQGEAAEPVVQSEPPVGLQPAAGCCGWRRTGPHTSDATASTAATMAGPRG